MKKVVGERDDFVMDALFYFEPVHRFEYAQFWGFELLREQESFAAPGEEIFFAVSLGKISYNSLI